MTEMNRYPFQDHTLHQDTRVRDLISRLTAEEKIESMLQHQPAVERLGISAYKHGTEAAHGISWLGEATFFPQPVGLACTWDADLMKRVGNVISDEARVMYKRNPTFNGLTLWAPTVDMERDPRWGRNEEAYGEDPKLTGELTSHLIQGIQGDHPTYLKAVATLKHFLGNNNEVDRGTGSSSIDPRNMREYYLKAFEQPFIEGGAQSMMTSYNSINGTPAILHPLVHEVVKGEWGMDGFIVSDAGDMMGIMRDHGYYDSHTPGVAASIKAGIDSITDDAELSKAALKEALEQGLLSWDDIDRALFNTFRVRFRLGEFDPAELNPYAAIGEESMMTEAAKEVSAEAARKSVVLLKNEHMTLPLSATSAGSVAVIGELGNVVYRDWYSGTLPYAVPALEAIRNKVAGDVHYSDGNDRVTFHSEDGLLLSVKSDAPVIAAESETVNLPEIGVVEDEAAIEPQSSLEQMGGYVVAFEPFAEHVSTDDTDTHTERMASDQQVATEQLHTLDSADHDATVANRTVADRVEGDPAVTAHTEDAERLAAEWSNEEPEDDQHTDADIVPEKYLFNISDWGYGSYTIRSEATGTYLVADDEQQRVAVAGDEIYGWFAKEVLHLEQQSDERTHIRTWNNLELYHHAEDHSLSIAQGQGVYPPVRAEWQRSAIERQGVSSVGGPADALAQDHETPLAGGVDTSASQRQYGFTKTVITDGIQQAATLAAASETAIVFVGNHPLINGKEEVDRPGLELADAQLKLIQEVYAVNPNTVVVVVGSYPFAMEWVEEHIPAIVYLSHAGPELGNAVADVLYGDYAPAGRLNMTWYRSAEQLGDLRDYDMIRSEKTYQYFAGDVLYPFGHGLTYSPIVYSELEPDAAETNLGEQITFSVKVHNTGTVDTDEVVQLYSRMSSQSRVKRPLRTLQAFRRIHLVAGAEKIVTFQIPVQQLAFWDVTRSRYVVEDGTYTFMAGRSSADIRMETEVILHGEIIPPQQLQNGVRAENYDDYRHVHLVESKEGGAAVEALADGAWIQFSDVALDLDASNAIFEARAAYTGQSGEIQIRLDSYDGPLLGTATLAASVEEQGEQDIRTTLNRIQTADDGPDTHANEVNASDMTNGISGAEAGHIGTLDRAVGKNITSDSDSVTADQSQRRDVYLVLSQGTTISSFRIASSIL
ncbi:glycoside hydrolase family 3 C-terminal domain-containing protein [Paenibacillus kandeliae]|uniref:glycoside hydrolase family 3 C-terminal domain-containing protein n=1 Tax=Paenibacillus kandeliae TaxID=3231269 RepID=UPI00345A9684